MKFSKAIAGLGAILAFSLPVACSGDDTTISSPSAHEATDAPEVTVEETTSPTTAAPTTVEATTTTVAAPNDSYNLSSIVLEYIDGIYVGPIPDGAKLPYQAQNPESDAAATLGDLVGLSSGSPDKNAVCMHLPDGTGLTAGFDRVGLESNYNGGSPVTVVMVYLKENGANASYLAYDLGVIPSEDGTTYVVGLYVTIGAC